MNEPFHIDAGEQEQDSVEVGDAVERRECRVPASMHGQRLDKLLVLQAPEFSRTYLQRLVSDGHVKVDGQAATLPSRKVQVGQAVELNLVPTAESQAFRAEAVPLQVVYEDEELLVIDKSAGLVVHPAAGNWSGTVLNGLLHRHREAAALPRAGIVHRLDKDTSGLMVVGKTLRAVTGLSRAIAARVVHRGYDALVQGEPGWSALSIDAPIGRDPKSRVRMAAVASGRAARTDVEVVGRRDGYAAIRCRLHTGRTHQIRVHLASRGHPLVGDALYGGPAALGMQRQALHAARLAFAHPVDGREISLQTPLPPDMAGAWTQVVHGPS